MPGIPRKTIYQGRIVDLGLETFELPDGTPVELEVIRHSGASAIVPILPDGSVLLIRQFRHAGGGFLLEIPAGRMEQGETPEQCATRELGEETGYRAASLTPMGSILTTPGFCDERIHLFLARELTPGPRRLDFDEYLANQAFPMSRALDAIASGEIQDAKTIAGLFLAARRVGVLGWGGAGCSELESGPGRV